jgi:hypothetical protein
MNLKHLTLAGILVAAPTAATASKPNAADYKLSVRVQQTELVYACNSSLFGSPQSCGMRLLMVVIINGQGLQLRANTSSLLRTGEYKAKLISEQGKSGPVPAYLDQRAYEILLPDGKVMTFEVVGESQYIESNNR